ICIAMSSLHPLPHRFSFRLWILGVNSTSMVESVPRCFFEATFRHECVSYRQRRMLAFQKYTLLMTVPLALALNAQIIASCRSLSGALVAYSTQMEFPVSWKPRT